jgi:hypothetical protein
LLITSLVQSLDDDAQTRRQGKRWWIKLKRCLVEALQRPKQNDEPGLILVDDFLTDAEASLLLQRYEPLLRESLHFGTGTAAKSQYRTSHSLRLPPNGDELVFEIEERAANLAGFPHSHVEDFQLACYRVNELYGLHRDDHDDPVKRADRSATVLIYLKAPKEGGATLFTRRPIEEERDLDTKRTLTTEKGALKLFRAYCNHPKKKHVVVEPQVGRAATWKNWHGENHTSFCKKSTHGACPVISGKKCVIQQWITRTNPLPLREPRLAAIFTAGADFSFRERNSTATNVSSSLHESKCLLDASTNRGKVVPKLCLQQNAKFQALDASEGPYRGVGGLRLTGGGLSGSIPSSIMSQDGLTISFWARNVSDGAKLLSLGDMVSVAVRFTEQQSSTKILELLRPEEPLSEHSSSNHFTLDSPAQDWLWFSFKIDRMLTAAHLNVFSRSGEPLGSASIQLGDSCFDKSNEATLELQLFSPTSSITNKTAFISSPEKNSAAFLAASAVVDVSFILIHKVAIDADDIVAIRKEVARYNIDA